MNNNQEYTYFAFISYNSADEKWAKWFHKKLENYVIPTKIRETDPTIPSKIRPIFWYKTDLSGTSLHPSLHKELESSKFLIVLCSPNSAKSSYVNEEVEYFIRHGRTDRIIPVILSGEPHSSNVNEECFPPAILNLPEEEEIRGIDINEYGKSKALVNVIASMFGIRFDILWDRFKRRLRMQRAVMAICIMLLCLIGIGYWDYTRTKVEYFADYVDKWGLPEGVVHLSSEQVAHRYASFKFEYKRIPFGEKGFYSWQLKRVSLVNSKCVVFNGAPDNHQFFYPIQEFKYTDGYISDIINKDELGRVVIRYSIKNDKEQNTACLVDLIGKENRQGSAYLNASTTALATESMPNNTMSKIKRFHYTRNKDGYIIKVTYHANDDDELSESAIGDNNNIYGKKFDIDEFGRIAKVTYLSSSGDITTDKFGVAYVRMNNASFECTDTVEYLGIDENLAINERKFARKLVKFDKYGNPIEEYYEGVDGQPCYNYQNLYKEVSIFNESGFPTETRCIGIDGKLAYCYDNFAIRKFRYDNLGRCVEYSHFDTQNKPCFTSCNYSILKKSYNKNNCITRIEVYDINGNPCIEKNTGIHAETIEYDKDNYGIKETCYDVDNKMITSPTRGYAYGIVKYDQYHNIISICYFDEDNNPCTTSDWISSVQCKYDNRGNLIETIYKDTKEKYCLSKEGFAKAKCKFDEHGNQLNVRWYNTNDEAIYINGVAGEDYEYYTNGLIKTKRYLDEKGNLILNGNWVAIERYKYDVNGNCTEVSYFDTDSIPCITKDRLCSSIKYEYDSLGNLCKEFFYDSKGNLTYNDKFFAIAIYKCDAYGRVTEYSYYDVNMNPCYYNKNFHAQRVAYNKQGNKVKIEYYGLDNRLRNDTDGSAIITYKYDSKNNIIQTDWFDEKMNKTNLDRYGFSSERLKYDKHNRVVEVAYFDKTGEPCWSHKDNGTFHKENYEYDNMGNLHICYYYSPNGNLSQLNGVAKKELSHDKYGHITEEKYLKEDGSPANQGYFSKIGYKYNKKGKTSQVSYYDTKGNFYININYEYDKQGNVIIISNTDETGNLKDEWIPGVSDTKYAKKILSYDSRGLNIKSEYYGADGKHRIIEDGFSILENDFDKYGRLVCQRVYGTDKKPTHSNTLGWYKMVRKYDERGLQSEEAYFDEFGNYVNSSTFGNCCKGVFYYNEFGQLDYEKCQYFCIYNGRFLNTNDISQEKPEENVKIANGDAIVVSVEFPGLFKDNNLSGRYLLLKFNDWTIYDNIDKFSEVFNLTVNQDKDLLLVPINADGYGDVVKIHFPPGKLGVRMMDTSIISAYNDCVRIYNTYMEQNK